jgi:hypothetical protein
MGGIGFTVTIERLQEDGDVKMFHRQFWKMLESTFLRYLKPKAYDITLVDYLPSSVYDGFEDGDWYQTKNELHFSFRDMAGCCGLSCEAAMHWTTLAFSYRISEPSISQSGFLSQPNAFRLVGPVENPISRLRRGGISYPLLILRRKLWATVRQRADSELSEEDTLFTDSEPGPKLSELSQKERDSVDWSALTGLCQCHYCQRVIKLGLAPGEVPVIGGEIQQIRSAWALFETNKQAQELEKAALAVVRKHEIPRYFPSKVSKKGMSSALPEELQVLTDYLEEHNARPSLLPLVAMLFNRSR